MLLDALHAVLVVTLADDCPTKHVDAAMQANRTLGRMSKHPRVLVGDGCCSGGSVRTTRRQADFPVISYFRAGGLVTALYRRGSTTLGGAGTGDWDHRRPSAHRG